MYHALNAHSAPKGRSRLDDYFDCPIQCLCYMAFNCLKYLQRMREVCFVRILQPQKKPTLADWLLWLKQHSIFHAPVVEVLGVEIARNKIGVFQHF